MSFGYRNTINNFINFFPDGNGRNTFVETIYENIRRNGQNPGIEQRSAWGGLFTPVSNLFKELKKRNLGELTCVFEYFLPFSSERIDLILLGKNNQNQPLALIFELKGWERISLINNFTVNADNDIHQHPDLQLSNYLGKLQFSHTASQTYTFKGLLWFYNLTGNGIKTNQMTYYADDSQIANDIADLFTGPLTEKEIDQFINGQYIQTTRLFDTIRDNLNDLKNQALNILADKGFAPSEQQSILISDVLQTIENDERRAFFIQGEPGSGKTYIALLLLFEIVKKFGNSQQNLVVLGYRNNRLINTIRDIFNRGQSGLDTFIKFYSTGRNKGLAEGDSSNPHFRVVIYDEAQRMNKNNIQIALQRGDITVFFYDEKQILNAEEEGWQDNFINIAKKLNIPFEQRILTGIHRVRGGDQYHKFVESLITGNKPENNFENYDFKVFDNINDMICALKLQTVENRKVALVASFTESPGDRNNPNASSIENLRVGFPLFSNFNHYQNTDLQIYWLMDPQNQYPQFWAGGESNNLTHCASIYGCQGFEADYIGLIWGRDFIWRRGQWSVGNNCEDSIGKPSLKKIIEQINNGNYEKFNLAIRLLRNRYRIFLTRGILGTYIYCEDEETREYLHKLITID